MKKCFSLPVSNIDIVEINNGDFLKLKIYSISDKVNRNNSEFLLESFEDGIKTIYNKPILAYFNKNLNDTEEHNSKLDIDFDGEVFYDYDYDGAEKPVGVIPESANIYIEEKDDKNWIVIENAYIWTEYNTRLTKLIKKQITKKVSVEVESLDSFVDENGIERIKKWKFLGITILGKYKDGSIVDEGIEGAKLLLSDYNEDYTFNTYKKKFQFAMKNNGQYSSDILNKYGVKFYSDDIKYGTGEPIKVNKSKDKVSNDSWGDVNKSKLRDTVLKAKNYKTLVKSVYLKVEDGWEESPSEKLKYPVMQLKDGEFVYNSGALLSAQQYGAQYDKEVENKAIKIRKSLGLIKPDKEENMKDFIEKAKESGFSFIGTYSGKLAFAKECDCDKMDMSDEKEEIMIFEVDKCVAEEYKCEEEFNLELMSCKPLKFEDEDDEEDDDDEEDKDDDEEKKEMAMKIAALEKEKEEMKAKCEKAESELKEIRMSKFKEDTDCIMKEKCEDMSDEDKECLKKMRDEGKFATVEEFEKEVAYKKYLADEKCKKEMSKGSSKLSFGINILNKETKNSQKTLIDKLDRI